MKVIKYYLIQWSSNSVPRNRNARRRLPGFTQGYSPLGESGKYNFDHRNYIFLFSSSPSCITEAEFVRENRKKIKCYSLLCLNVLFFKYGFMF
jgi:hypothetical protein